MKIKPEDPYLLIRKYVKPVTQGKLILSQEENYNNWGIIDEQYLERFKVGWIVQMKPYSKIPIDGSDDLFLVKHEDVIAIIEE